MKKILALIICICLVFLLTGLLPVHGEAEIYDSVLRLHVLANSDSDEDQALKLCVRDRVTALVGELCADCQTLEETRAVLEENLDAVGNVAEQEILSQGFDYPTEVRLCEEEYPQKTYASLCFPSGKYLSLQVRIGSAEGQNWWCVLFPPLCLEAASGARTDEEAFVSVGLTSDQYKIITESQAPVYEARFKFLEMLSETFG